MADGGVALAEGGRGAKGEQGYRFADTTLDGRLETWPEEAPVAPKSQVQAVRLELIASAGEVHRLGWKFSDVFRASRMASDFRRAKPAKLLPSADGRFDARAYFDPAERKWRIAARYVPGPGASAQRATPGAGGG